MPWTVDPPTYNSRYGYSDGAQDDIFIAAPVESSSSSGTSTPSSPSTSGIPTAAPTTSIPSGAGRGYRIHRMSSLSLCVLADR
jgi:hypothetical protein